MSRLQGQSTFSMSSVTKQHLCRDPQDLWIPCCKRRPLQHLKWLVDDPHICRQPTNRSSCSELKLLHSLTSLIRSFSPSLCHACPSPPSPNRNSTPQQKHVHIPRSQTPPPPPATPAAPWGSTASPTLLRHGPSWRAGTPPKRRYQQEPSQHVDDEKLLKSTFPMMPHQQAPLLVPPIHR